MPQGRQVSERNGVLIPDPVEPLDVRYRRFMQDGKLVTETWTALVGGHWQIVSALPNGCAHERIHWADGSNLSFLPEKAQ
jgi:hypothetical protein